MGPYIFTQCKGQQKYIILEFFKSKDAHTEICKAQTFQKPQMLSP
jgi:hypothetical protein